MGIQTIHQNQVVKLMPSILKNLYNSTLIVKKRWAIDNEIKHFRTVQAQVGVSFLQNGRLEDLDQKRSTYRYVATTVEMPLIDASML